MTIGDDTILYHWKLKTINKNLPIISKPGYNIYDLKEQCWTKTCFEELTQPERCKKNNDRGWLWWDKFYIQTLQSYDEMRTSNSSLIKQCYRNLKIRNKGKYRVNFIGGIADMYYLPKRFDKAFQIITRLFARHGVFMEIAIPTTLQCLYGNNNIHIVSGSNIFFHRDRIQNMPVDINKWAKIFNVNIHYFVHPFKLNAVKKKKLKSVFIYY